MSEGERDREITAALERLGLVATATAHEVHGAYRARLDAAREAGDKVAVDELRRAYALLRRRAGMGGSRSGSPTPKARTGPPPPPPPRRERVHGASVAEVWEMVDQGRMEDAARRVCEADWHRALAERGRWEDALIRLACATRWTAPQGYKLLHDHHGAILARPALGNLARAYVQVAETTTAWTGWHEFREVDPRLEAFYTRALVGSLVARQALLRRIGEWIARDRAGFLKQLESIASISDRLLALLELLCDQLRDDLRVDLPRVVDPDTVSEELSEGFPPSARALGLGLVAGGTVIGGSRAFLPSLFGGSLIAGFSERFVSVMLSTRRRSMLLDLCLDHRVSVQGLAEWAARQSTLSRARPWAEALASDQVLRVAYAFERLTRRVDATRHGRQAD